MQVRLLPPQRRDAETHTEVTMRFVRILGAVALLIAFNATQAFADADIDAIQQNLMCQCGCTMVLYSCDCGTAEQMRGEIKTMLSEGKTQQQVLDSYVSKYGEKVLAAPTKQGFNLSAYITPFAGIVVAGGSVLLVLRRWVFRGKKAVAAALAPLTVADNPTPISGREHLRTQLARDLENYD
jgi:cytochrome c-type biogenesis protein CcmH